MLERGIDGHRFSFFVISAAPREVIQSALAGVVPPDHIFGTELEYDDRTGEVRVGRRVSRPATARSPSSRSSRSALGIGPDRTIYVGDGSSDVHVMLHVNNRDGYTIAVSENRQLARIAKSTVLSDDAVERDGAGAREGAWAGARAKSAALFESNGLTLHEWEKARTDRVTVRESSGRHARLSALIGATVMHGGVSRAGWRQLFSSGPISAPRADRLKRVQMLGALMWVAYGLFIGASPVVAANLMVFGAAAWTTARQRPA